MLRLAVVIWLFSCGVIEILHLFDDEYRDVQVAKMFKILFICNAIYYVLN